MTVRRAAVAAVVLAAAAAAGRARGQTMLDQEQRLIEIHSLLVDLPAVEAPGALGPGEASLGLEVVGIPKIDGTTGTKRQITASDRTPAFPRPRVAVGLPAPAGFRAFAGASYIPPVSIRGISSHDISAEAGLAWTPGPLRIGVRGHAAYALSRSPVTDPATRDVLRTFAAGAEVTGGWRLVAGPASVTPYAGVGLVHVDGRFRVTSDGTVLTATHDGPALHAGVRVLLRARWEAVGEVEASPGRLVHPALRLGYVFDLWRR